MPTSQIGDRHLQQSTPPTSSQDSGADFALFRSSTDWSGAHQSTS